MSEKAFELFKTIKNPDETLLCLFFNSCAQIRTSETLNFARQVWSRVSSLYPNNQFIRTAVLDMFIKCGDLPSAEETFLRMKRSVISYGHLMNCYNAHSMPMKTLDLYRRMRNEGINADVVTFVLLVDACAELGLESRCQWIVEQIPVGMLNHVHLQGALIDMWVGRLSSTDSLRSVVFNKGKVGCVDQAKQVFDQIDEPNSVIYTAMSEFVLNRMSSIHWFVEFIPLV